MPLLLIVREILYKLPPYLDIHILILGSKFLTTKEKNMGESS